MYALFCVCLFPLCLFCGPTHCLLCDPSQCLSVAPPTVPGAPPIVFSVAPPTAGLSMSLMDKEQELSKVQAELEKLQPFKVS